jgi:D-alanyl-D-alanine carboxypeptidase
MRVILMQGLIRASPVKTRKPLVIAARPETAGTTAPMRIPVPVRVRAPATATASRPPAPRLVEPVASVHATATGGGEARQGTGVWRSEVRIAAPISAGSSVASRLAPDTGLARPPSTLSAQAANLGNRAAPTWAPQLSQAARHAPAPASSKGAQIQIGAFAAPSEARERLESARRMLPTLAGAGVATPPVDVRGRTLYRARFTGFDVSSAAAACSELKRRQIDCMVATE